MFRFSSLAKPLVWLLLSLPTMVLAHEVPPSIVSLDIGASSIRVTVELPEGDLGKALQLQTDTFSTEGEFPEKAIHDNKLKIMDYIATHLRFETPAGEAFKTTVQSIHQNHTSNVNWTGNDWVVAELMVRPPKQNNTETFKLINDLLIDRVLSHRSMIYVGQDVRNQLMGDAPLQIGVTSFGDNQLKVDGSEGSWWKAFSTLVKAGMRHIASGPDHLLFLFMLLIPTSLVCRQGRWQENKPPRQSLRAILAVITGFTIGHSVTLALATLGVVPAAGKLVEILIAVSILVSSIHACRPIFAGREIWIASGFGLVHGLAFAEVLAGMRFDITTLAISLLGFNVGIELMQFIVIAALLPSILWLNTTRFRTMFRHVCAGIASLCALFWIGERAFFINGLLPIVNGLTLSSNELAVIFSITGVASLSLLSLRQKNGSASSPRKSGVRNI